MASRIVSGDENLPVPKIKRDRKILPAMTNGWLDKDIANILGKDTGFVEALNEAVVP